MSVLKEYPDVTARLLTTCTMKSLSTFYRASERSYQNSPNVNVLQECWTSLNRLFVVSTLFQTTGLPTRCRRKITRMKIGTERLSSRSF
jgi:hypothetical protein